MSKKYNKVKNYYDSGFWNIEMVRDAVIRGWITVEEYMKITGKFY